MKNAIEYENNCNDLSQSVTENAKLSNILKSVSERIITLRTKLRQSVMILN